VYLDVVCRALVGATFLAAAVGKLHNRAAFAAFVDFIGLIGGRAVLPARYVRTVAAVTVLAEAAVGPLMLSQRTARPGAALAMVLLVAFIAVIAAVLRRGAAVSCPCFGVSGSPLGRRHLARNAFLLGAAAVALAGPRSSPYELAGVVVAVGAGLVAATVIVRLDDLVTLFDTR
jgi:hypothetical protein